MSEEITAEVTEETIIKVMPSDAIPESSGPSGITIEQTDTDWPACWTLDQRNDFCKKHDWLSIRLKKLGCIPREKVGNLGVETKMGMKISQEWANNNITHNILFLKTLTVVL